MVTVCILLVGMEDVPATNADERCVGGQFFFQVEPDLKEGKKVSPVKFFLFPLFRFWPNLKNGLSLTRVCNADVFFEIAL